MWVLLPHYNPTFSRVLTCSDDFSFGHDLHVNIILVDRFWKVIQNKKIYQY